MGLEQQDIYDRSREKDHKKEEKEKLDFFESQKLRRETSELLQKLAAQISKEFGIDISRARELISGSASSKLEDLQSSFHLGESLNIRDLKGAIEGAKTQIEQLSKDRREQLKKSLESDSYDPDTHEYNISTKLISKDLRNRITYPKNISDNIIGAGVGVVDSAEAVILFLYGLGKGILLTPYHIYLFATGKIENPFK